MKDMNFSFVSFEKIKRINSFELQTLIHLPKGKIEIVNDKGLFLGLGKLHVFFHIEVRNDF
jgi:hypothetical protein